MSSSASLGVLAQTKVSNPSESSEEAILVCLLSFPGLCCMGLALFNCCYGDIVGDGNLPAEGLDGGGEEVGLEHSSAGFLQPHSSLCGS